MHKILLAAPTARVKDYCFTEWAKNIKNLCYKNLDVLLIDNSKDDRYQETLKNQFETIRVAPKQGESNRELIARCQNVIRKSVLTGGYDFLFSLETDLFPPKNIVEYLLHYNKKVVGCTYFIGQALDSKLMWFELQDFGAYRQSKPIELKKAYLKFDGRLKTVYQLGLGCLLIHRSVLQRVPFRVDLKDEEKAHSDTYFHEDLRSLNIPCYMSTNVIVEHKNINWHKIKSNEL